MSWNPWADAAQLRASLSSYKRRVKELEASLAHERMVSKVFHDANHKLVGDVYTAQRELAQAKAQMATMHRRDPVTGRLLPRGK